MNFKNKIYFEKYEKNNVDDAKIMKPNLSTFQTNFTNFKFTNISIALQKTVDFFYSTMELNEECELNI